LRKYTEKQLLKLCAKVPRYTSRTDKASNGETVNQEVKIIEKAWNALTT